MKLRPAVISAVVVVLVAAGGGATLAAIGRADDVAAPGPAQPASPADPSASPSAPGSSTPKDASTPAATPTPKASTSSSAPASAPASSSSPSSAASNPTPKADPLSAENLLRERAYHDATGHDLTLAARADDLHIPCGNDLTLADMLPRQSVTIRSIQLDGPHEERVVQQLAQVASAAEARTAATEIITETQDCLVNQGGDFGYGDPVTISSDDTSELVYFPAYDSDRAYGGYIVLQTGARVGVIDVSDALSVSKLVKLAKLAAEIAAV